MERLRTRPYATAEQALEAVSPVSTTHDVPPGRYYKVAEGGEFLFVDLCLFGTDRGDHPLEAERHGVIKPLFGKGGWLQGKSLDEYAFAAKREERRLELPEWFASGNQTRKGRSMGRKVAVRAPGWPRRADRQCIEAIAAHGCERMPDRQFAAVAVRPRLPQPRR